MTLSLQELHDRLSAIEPTEEIYAGIDEEEIPALEQLLQFEEAWLASRAAYALARVGGARAAEALGKAAEDRRPEVRIAVADSAQHLPREVSDSLVAGLLADGNAGVRKFALRAASDESGSEVRRNIEQMANEDPLPVIRDEARQRLEQLGGTSNP